MKDLIKKGLVNKYTLFLEHYKNISITDSESIILLHIFKIQEDPKNIIHFDDFEKTTSMNKKRIENTFASLTKKNLIKVNFKKGWKIDVSNVWNKIVEYIEAKEDKESIEQIKKRVENITEKTLKVNEVKFLEKIIDKGHFDQIEETIKTLEKNKDRINFQTLEETIIINIDKINDLEDEVIDYNWLSNK